MAHTCNVGGEVLDRNPGTEKDIKQNQGTSIMYGFNNNVSILGSLTVRNVPYELQMLRIGETGYTGTSLHNNSVNLKVNSKKESVFRQSKLLMWLGLVWQCAVLRFLDFYLLQPALPQRSCTP